MLGHDASRDLKCQASDDSIDKQYTVSSDDCFRICLCLQSQCSLLSSTWVGSTGGLGWTVRLYIHISGSLPCYMQNP